jgi:hypothetical protein
MDDELRQQAQALLSAAPCSIEMPAGTGKTHLLAAAAAVAAESERRSLILTHTNAGVEAIRKRLKSFGISSSLVRVETITSWAFALVGSYSQIAGVSVTGIPDWSKSKEYLRGARQVVLAEAIKNVHEVSFDYLLVDEYQDCTLVLHDFILALAVAVPKTIVFGDELQAIFTFDGPMATWPSHVLPNFPPQTNAPQPHRWMGYNSELGAWLLSIRSALVPGATFDLAAHNVPGLRFVTSGGPTTLSSVAHSFRDFDESVVLLDKWAPDVARHASRLGGTYSVMEDIGGKFMREQLESLPPEGDYLLAAWFARWAKACVIGLADIDLPVLSRLDSNQSITHYSRNGLAPVLIALDEIRTSPTYVKLAEAATIIRHLNGLRVYRWEAWNDTREAISMTAENGEPAVDNLGRIRDRLRRSGRANYARIASRTLLVKGLEFDHVIIADFAKFTDPRNLYVALSRARKSVTVVGGSSQITLRNDP